MLNVVAMVLRVAVPRFARWLCAVVLVSSIGQRPLAWLSMRGRACSYSGCRAPAMGQQLRDPAVQLRGQPREHVFQVGLRIVPVKFGRLRRAPNYAEWARPLL